LRQGDLKVQTRDAAIVGLVVILVLVLIFALTGAGMMGPGMMGWQGWGNQGTSAWWGIGMMLFWVVLLAGLAGLVVWLVRSGSPATAGPTGTGSRPEEILRERYARGEITREQYDQMRRDLRDE
jgi:putative membrane protein